MSKIRQDLFMHTLQSLRYGVCQEELSEKLNAGVRHCQDTGKACELVLRIKIKPFGQGQYELRDRIELKMAPAETGATLMFGTPEGNLTRQSPNQQNLNLQTVPEPAPANFVKVE